MSQWRDLYLEVKKPQSKEILYLNGYVNGMGRAELNYSTTH